MPFAFRSPRPRLLWLVAACTAAVGLVLAPAASGASAARTAPAYAYCPAGHPLVHDSTPWHRHTLAPGVTLAETKLPEGRGRVDVHVLRADLTQPGVAVTPLYRTIHSVHPLTTLADRPGVVAAVNGMYFDYPSGGPVVPFIAGSQPAVLSTTAHRVAGIGQDGLAEDGDARLTATLQVGDTVLHLVGINQARPLGGFVLYTSGWGPARVPLTDGALSRAIGPDHTDGPAHRVRHVPAGGYLLVATGTTAKAKLRSLTTGDPVILAGQATSTSASPFAVGYGVGTQLVADPGQVRRHLYCKSDEIDVARTAIGWADGGRQLLLVVVSVRAGTRQRGVDENQMSYLLTELGAERAYALDGGGSSEMVARPGPAGPLRILGGVSRQRPVPVGLGISAGSSAGG
jgi:hypothetical protein